MDEIYAEIYSLLKYVQPIHADRHPYAEIKSLLRDLEHILEFNPRTIEDLYWLKRRHVVNGYRFMTWLKKYPDLDWVQDFSELIHDLFALINTV